MNSPLLNTQQAAEHLNVSPAFLERDRWAGARIPYIRVGSRSIRYREEDLEEFIDSVQYLSTSEYDDTINFDQDLDEGEDEDEDEDD